MCYLKTCGDCLSNLKRIAGRYEVMAADLRMTIADLESLRVVTLDDIKEASEHRAEVRSEYGASSIAYGELMCFEDLIREATGQNGMEDNDNVQTDQ